MPPSSSEPKSLIVLVVDDNELNRRVLQMVAETLGATVRTAENGAEALEKMAEQKFDLVFMDIMMPVLNGIDATRKVRESGDSVPVVAVSAHYDAADGPKLRALGFDGLIPKPVRIEAVDEFLARAAAA